MKLYGRIEMNIINNFYIILVTICLLISGCSREYDEPLRIVFQRGNTGTTPCNLWIINRDGTGEKQITSQGLDHSPSWSPDVSTVTFIRNSNVYIINVDEKQINQVTSMGSCLSPTWSPNMEQICFLSGGGAPGYRIRVDGSNLVPLPLGYYSPTWSPDGTKIARVNNGIVIDDAVTGATLTTIAAGAGKDASTWSPDGTKLAFTYVSAFKQIHIINADNTGEVPITTDNWTHSVPSWSPDGKEIVFSSNESGVYQIYIMNSDGSGKRRITFSGINEDNPCFEGKPR